MAKVELQQTLFELGIEREAAEAGVHVLSATFLTAETQAEAQLKEARRALKVALFNLHGGKQKDFLLEDDEL